MIVRIMGKAYRLVFRNHLGRDKATRKHPEGEPVWGTCDSPNLPEEKRFIKIRRKQKSDKDELSTIIHECTHAADWHKDEEWVSQFGDDMAEVLWKLGWRKT